MGNHILLETSQGSRHILTPKQLLDKKQVKALTGGRQARIFLSQGAGPLADLTVVSLETFGKVFGNVPYEDLSHLAGLGCVLPADVETYCRSLEKAHYTIRYQPGCKMELKGVSHSPFSHNDMFVYLGYFSKLKTCSNGIPCLDGKGHLYVEEGALASRHKFLMAMAGLSYFNNEVHFKNKRPALASSISMLPDGVPYHIQGEGRIEDRVGGSFGPLDIRFEYAQGPAG